MPRPIPGRERTASPRGRSALRFARRLPRVSETSRHRRPTTHLIVLGSHLQRACCHHSAEQSCIPPLAAPSLTIRAKHSAGHDACGSALQLSKWTRPSHPQRAHRRSRRPVSTLRRRQRPLSSTAPTAPRSSARWSRGHPPIRPTPAFPLIPARQRSPASSGVEEIPSRVAAACGETEGVHAKQWRRGDALATASIAFSPQHSNPLPSSSSLAARVLDLVYDSCVSSCIRQFAEI